MYKGFTSQWLLTKLVWNQNINSLQDSVNNWKHTEISSSSANTGKNGLSDRILGVSLREKSLTPTQEVMIRLALPLLLSVDLFHAFVMSIHEKQLWLINEELTNVHWASLREKPFVIHRASYGYFWVGMPSLYQLFSIPGSCAFVTRVHSRKTNVVSNTWQRHSWFSIAHFDELVIALFERPCTNETECDMTRNISW